MAKKISELTATTLQAGDEVEIHRPSAPTSDLRAPLDSGTVRAERIDSSMLPFASVDLPFLSLFAFDQENDMASVLVPATTVSGGGGGGGAAGGFTTQIDPTPGVAFNIGSNLNGIHRLLDVAAQGTLLDEAQPSTRVALTAASAGTTTVQREGGATYRIKGVDDPGDPGRTATMTLSPAGYYEFEVIRNVGGAAAEWDVYGIPVGITTRLSGGLDLNAQTIIPGAPIAVTAARTYLTTDSGKNFRVDFPATTTSTQTINAGMGAGWRVTILNNTAGTIPIDGPGSTNVTLASGEVCEIMFWSTTTIKVARGVTVGIN